MALLGRDTSVTGPFPEGVLLLETLRGKEVLGKPYEFELTLLSKEPDIDPDDVIGQPLAVRIRLNTGADRFFHGIVTDFSKVGLTNVHTRYAAELKPLLSVFGHTLDCRVFNVPAQDASASPQNALTIVKAVLAQRGLTDVESGSIEDHVYRAREYCVQFRESDLCFVQRLLEEEGIYHYFRHEQTKHTLVLTDSIRGHETVPGYESVLYSAKQRRVAGSEEHFWGMKVRRALYPGRHTVLSGYDPTEIRPKQSRFGRATSEDLVTGYPFEHYDYPGGLTDPQEADQEANVRSEAGRTEHTIIEVQGDTVGLGVGNLVSLRKGVGGLDDANPFWDEEDFGQQFLIVGANYSLSINQVETGEVASSDEPFKATYQLQNSQTQFRPERTTRKPIMGGAQTAVVVGPAGDEIKTDSLGRVMVQFDWDRLGEHNEKSSCWIRVSQAWAGSKWGAIHIPRIGQEVIVDFLDGDPDRPIITGRAYNADNMPPYDLPANQTQSGIKSRSTKGGTANNFNEIRFEDKKGQEELHLQAEKDMSTLVKHNQTLEVGVDRSIVVGNDEDTHIKHNRKTTVDVNDEVIIDGTHTKTVTKAVKQEYHNDHMRYVGGDQMLTVEKNKTEHVTEAYTLNTAVMFQLNQGPTNLTFVDTDVTLDSAGMITMKAGGAMALVDKAGMITLTSPTGIALLCGGAGLTLLPGAIAITATQVTAASGSASTMKVGESEVTMKSKTVTIEAEDTCSIKGKSVLKLNTT
jgi:type VI secretion system secreted protein VgrG